MRSRAIVLLAAALTLGAAPLPLESQATLIGQPFSVCWVGSQAGEYWCSLPHVAALATGRFAVGTEDGSLIRHEDEADDYSYNCGVDYFDPLGERVGGHSLESHSLESGEDPGSPAVAADGSGGFVASWRLSSSPDSYVLARRFLGPEAVPEQDESWGLAPGPWPGENCAGQPDVATNFTGQFAISWRERPCSGAGSWVAVRAYGTARRPVTPYLRIEADSADVAFSNPHVAIDGFSRFVVLWLEESRSGSALRGQRFGRDGRRLGSRFPIGGAGSNDASLAMLPDGTFAVGWNEFRPDGSHALFGWFTPEGLPSGSPIELPRGEGLMSLGLDRHGNAALLSLTGTADSSAIRLHLMNRGLVPQGEPAVLAEQVPYDSGSVAVQSSGRILAVWEDKKEYPSPDISVYPIFGQILQARHDADACSFRSDGFACDTAGDGAFAEQVIPFRGGEGGVPFLADWDGDGRADPCVYRGGRFACDTAHDGGAAEAETPAIGRAGDQPLLGDLDGDGKADPCVRRGVSFLCDRARDGGAKDLRIDFGLEGDFALLGDADGDGRDDPCVYRTGRFLCDTAHNGGTAEMVLDLRRPVPGQPAGTPLLGDLDGDGRDEACFATPTQRTCGFFHLGGGQPYRVERLTFGQGGEVPLMGDLDAF